MRPGAVVGRQEEKLGAGGADALAGGIPFAVAEIVWEGHFTGPAGRDQERLDRAKAQGRQTSRSAERAPPVFAAQITSLMAARGS